MQESYNYELIDRSSQKCKTVWKVINKVAKSNSFNENQNCITVHLEIFNDHFIGSVSEISSFINRPTVTASELLKGSIKHAFMQSISVLLRLHQI